MPKHMLPPAPPGFRWVFRAWRTDPNTGQKLWAKTYGKRAWLILVSDK
jgi:hypothetical protein